ncbi:MAG: hypothetical protein CVU09_05255 [Bacteroidetes bacterium HGW-Bacteroidetes-4]|jgi:hypothetical protein|nr:MAG: hypothetical protein CVU09_05255 [Bacteroidetes bacterium HGW-Bacteroidetes-4]
MRFIINSCFFLILTLNLASSGLWAQQNAELTYANAAKQTEEQAIAATYYINEYPLKKDQFFNDWALGTVYFTNGKKASRVRLRYNGWKDEMLWLRETDFKTGQIIKGTINKVILNNSGFSDSLVFIRYVDSSTFQKQQILLQEIARGYVSVYCHRKVVLVKGSDKFVQKHQYYLQIGENTPTKFNRHKKTLISGFSAEQQEQVRQTLKHNKTRLKTDAGLAKAIHFINQSF